MGFCGATDRWEGGGWSRKGLKSPKIPKICHTYPTMMKLGTVILYLKNIQKVYKSKKYMNPKCIWIQNVYVTHPLSAAGISIFLLEISKFCYIKKYRYGLHFDTLFLTLFNFFESLKIVLINLVTILMISAKMDALN